MTNVQQIIDRVAQLPALGKSDVEQLFGVQLVQMPSNPGERLAL